MKFETFYHKGKTHFNNNHTVIAKIYRLICKVCFNCDIPFQASIPRDVYFCHNAFGVVINPNVTIGGGTMIQHGVTIGELNSHDAPQIGKNVYIGARATILGNIVIGDNVKIGACCLVLDNIPDGCTVVGVPGKIVKRGQK